VPKNAEPGHQVTCPGCEEKFVPPHLHTVANDPQSTESYGFKAPEEEEEVDVERHEKKKRVKAIETAAEEMTKANEPPPSEVAKFEFSGIGYAAMALAILGGIAGIANMVISNRGPNVFEVFVFVLIAGGVGFFVWKKIQAQKEL
jgi:hypothetical protein